jgi:hypothetical protein
MTCPGPSSTERRVPSSRRGPPSGPVGVRGRLKALAERIDHELGERRVVRAAVDLRAMA